ncbi:uncharacterized protein [Prorops nasuta]|uniref:uncharacterized protein n=1 Tax=Prorops nasuta TaxID=863751 RepID=UPI0034CE543D
MKGTRSLSYVEILACLLVLANAVHAKNEYTKLFDRCATQKNAFDCLKRRALEILDNAIDDETVYVVNDFVSIKKDPTVNARSFGGSVDPANSTANATLDEQLDRKLHEYLSSRSIQLTIPGDTFEGRKKKEKYGGLMLGGLAIAGMMAQLAYGKIAFLAGTALLTAKIALVLSAIIGLKKLVSSGGGGHEVIYATASEHGGYGGGWQRALDGIPPT